jgi:hypothetical protein
VDLGSACAELGIDPLHHLSLGSKELFHSNFLAWLAERYPRQLAGAFSEVIGEGESSSGPIVERERAHLDLLLRLPGLRSAVVENKVWSLPDDTQLERYTSGAASKVGPSPALILLSLSKPLWDGNGRSFDGGTWTYLSYEALAALLLPVADGLSASVDADDRFAAELVQRYSTMVRRLCAVARGASIDTPDDPVWLDATSALELRRIRVHDGAAKLRAHTVVRHLTNTLRRDVDAADATARDAQETGLPIGGGWKYLWINGRIVGVEVGFSNGQPLLSGAVTLPNGDSLWWQFQGPAWRLAVTTAIHVGKGADVRSRRHAYISERYESWFDFSGVADVIGEEAAEPVPVRGSDRYHRYDPNFAYRYVKLDRHHRTVSVADFTTMASYYLQQATVWPASVEA